MIDMFVFRPFLQNNTCKNKLFLFIGLVDHSLLGVFANQILKIAYQFRSDTWFYKFSIFNSIQSKNWWNSIQIQSIHL